MNSRAMMLGVVGRPGAPFSPLDLDPLHYFWLLEGIVRDLNEKNSDTLDKLYRTGTARRERQRAHARDAVVGAAEREAAVRNFLRFALG